jgi:hypothetical protein
MVSASKSASARYQRDSFEVPGYRDPSALAEFDRTRAGAKSQPELCLRFAAELNVALRDNQPQ